MGNCKKNIIKRNRNGMRKDKEGEKERKSRDSQKSTGKDLE